MHTGCKICFNLFSVKSSIYSFNIFYSYITTESLKRAAQRDSRNIAISILHLPGIPYSLCRIGEVESYSNQMRLAAQMRTNGFSNSDIIKHTALVFQTH